LPTGLQRQHNADPHRATQPTAPCSFMQLYQAKGSRAAGLAALGDVPDHSVTSGPLRCAGHAGAAPARRAARGAEPLPVTHAAPAGAAVACAGAHIPAAASQAAAPCGVQQLSGQRRGQPGWQGRAVASRCAHRAPRSCVGCSALLAGRRVQTSLTPLGPCDGAVPVTLPVGGASSPCVPMGATICVAPVVFGPRRPVRVTDYGTRARVPRTQFLMILAITAPRLWGQVPCA
jgi:hypothetical protein